MEDRIERIGRTTFNSTRIERVRGYTPAERAEKIKEIEKKLADRAEIQAYLANYPNPDHLSFAELLDRAINENKMKDDELDYILEIGIHNPESDGYVISIGGKNGE